MNREAPNVNPDEEIDVTAEVEAGMQTTEDVFGKLGREIGATPLTEEERAKAEEWQNKGREKAA